MQHHDRRDEPSSIILSPSPITEQQEADKVAFAAGSESASHVDRADRLSGRERRCMEVRAPNHLASPSKADILPAAQCEEGIGFTAHRSADPHAE